MYESGSLLCGGYRPALSSNMALCCSCWILHAYPPMFMLSAFAARCDRCNGYVEHLDPTSVTTL